MVGLREEERQQLPYSKIGGQQGRGLTLTVAVAVVAEQRGAAAKLD